MLTKTIPLTAFTIGLAVTVMPASPVWAQNIKVKEAIAEYQKGVASGTTPLTRSEQELCLGHWYALKLTHEDYPNDRFWKKLPKELSLQAANLYVQGWAGFLTNNIQNDQAALERTNRAVENHTNAAYDKTTKGQQPDGIKNFFRTLGSCRFSAK